LEEIRPVKRDMTITSSKYLTKKEIDELVKISPPRLSLMIETMFITALRISELLNLRHDHMTEVKDGKKTYYEMRIVGKRNKENTVYISSELYKRINKVFNSKIFLFEHNGRQYRREFITMEIKRFGKLLGKNISAHKIRHSRAMNLAERGVSLDKISKFLCHASIGTTAGFYLHSKPSLDELNIYKK
jgi:integrase/recombinase XerD